MFTDSHCHIHLADKPSDQILSEAAANKVTTMLCVALNDEDLLNVIPLAENNENVYIAAAWHPNHDPGYVPSVETIIDLCKSHNKIISVGETGLDYFRNEGSYESMAWQRQRFVHHIEAAKQLNKPVIIHTRDAMRETIDMLSVEKAGECGGVLHCFTGDKDDAKRLLDIDFYISFSGITTFNSAQDIRDVIPYIPKDRLLIETDTPYLSPMPFRGRENQPAYVVYVAEKIAEVLSLSVQEVAEITTQNFKQLFLNRIEK